MNFSPRSHNLARPRRRLEIFAAKTPPSASQQHLFPLRSGHRLFQRPSSQKQIPSSRCQAPDRSGRAGQDSYPIRSHQPLYRDRYRQDFSQSGRKAQRTRFPVFPLNAFGGGNRSLGRYLAHHRPADGICAFASGEERIPADARVTLQVM